MKYIFANPDVKLIHLKNPFNGNGSVIIIDPILNKKHDIYNLTTNSNNSEILISIFSIPFLFSDFFFLRYSKFSKKFIIAKINTHILVMSEISIVSPLPNIWGAVIKVEITIVKTLNIFIVDFYLYINCCDDIFNF